MRKIPDFDPTQLPYWSLYSQKTLEGSDAKNVSYNPDVKIGGTMAGKFVAGLSGGQRKIMGLELVRQRTTPDGVLELNTQLSLTCSPGASCALPLLSWTRHPPKSLSSGS